ncbi:hypothetical protein CHS0354_005852 [Potamilus streckersoni]|uniref:Thioredoxin domain-containing protein 9 n=1 Tax=Potamilus streckersoni TaxID=2493646 RepID=A0AAE0TAD6_9BIVA|nr:hypothetical protein CHS0354_005852 [Potamilus streckersoni]
MENVLEKQMLQATVAMEDQIDAEIQRLDNLDDDDLEKLRQKRLDSMKQAQKQKQEWLAAGHGKYFEVADEKQFFEECKKSKNVVCHFYRDSTFRCKIVDKHMEILAPKHLETKFMKINAEKCKFLTERLKIKVIPTLCIAKDGKTADYIVGFDDLGGTDEFPTEMLEWRLGRSGCINYQGDLLHPPALPGQKKDTSVLGFAKKKTIRGGGGDSSSDEDDW